MNKTPTLPTDADVLRAFAADDARDRERMAVAKAHTPAFAKRLSGLGNVRLGRRFDSHRYTCPECGRSKFFGSNFLGTRHVVCDGIRFITIADRMADIRAAGVDVSLELAR